MLFLLLSALSSVVIALGFRKASESKTYVRNILFINYITAASFLLPFLVGPGEIIFGYSWKIWFLLTLIGIVFVVNFFLYSRCLAINGVGSSVTISRLSAIIPVLVGLLYFRESISLFQKLGIASTFFLFLILVRRKDVFEEIRRPALLTILFVLSGIGDSLVSLLNSSIDEVDATPSF
jgi:drug/metabolite transporter (DMT)-like permease